LITEKAWEFTQNSTERFQLIAQVVAQFSLIYDTTLYIQKHDEKSNKDLTVFLETMVSNFVELRDHCAHLRGGPSGDLDILKKKAEEVLSMLGPGFEAIQSNHKQLQELNQKIGDLQEKLINLYNTYYSNYLPELHKAEQAHHYQQLQAKYIDAQIETAKEQRELLQQQLKVAQQTDREKQKVLALEYEKKQVILTEAYRTRQKKNWKRLRLSMNNL